MSHLLPLSSSSPSAPFYTGPAVSEEPTNNRKRSYDNLLAEAQLLQEQVVALCGQGNTHAIKRSTALKSITLCTTELGKTLMQIGQRSKEILQSKSQEEIQFDQLNSEIERLRSGHCLKAALQKLEENRQLVNQKPYLLYFLFTIYYEAAQFPQARDVWAILHTNFPETEEYYLANAAMNFRDGDYEAVKETAIAKLQSQTATSSAPFYLELLILANFHQGHLDLANNLLQMALRTHPETATRFLYLSELIAKKEQEIALTESDQADSASSSSLPSAYAAEPDQTDSASSSSLPSAYAAELESVEQQH